jgi:TPP-dependent pyruvate/acetoin dehydrogenase alpha subunit
VTSAVEVSADVQKRLYALMVLMKAADDRLSKGIGTGEFMCVYWPSRGQEAIAAAMGVALRADDQLVTTYRGLHDLIGKGVPLEEIYGEMMGRTTGASRGKGGTMHIAKPENGVMLSTGIVGAGPPVAVGLAMSAKRKGLDRVTVVSFGDGATNTGSFHEAANMAALWDLPMVFVCQNNLYAEMTPTSDTMKLEHVADRAAGYGMPGVRVDGNDPLAVKSVLDEALRRARSGGGPTFIECASAATTSVTGCRTSPKNSWPRRWKPIRCRSSARSSPERASATRPSWTVSTATPWRRWRLRCKP